MANSSDSRDNWTLLTNVMLSAFLSGVAIRIFAISLPTLANNLGTDIIGISWAVIAYSLSTAGLSLVFGRIGDLYGGQTVFVLGLVVFTVASFLCGLSRNVSELIFFRLLQGIGAAMTQSQGRALAMEAVPKNRAGKAQGWVTAAYQIGFLLGPSLGGLIIEYIHWRGIFFFLVPIGGVGTFLTWMDRKRAAVRAALPEAAASLSIDYLGAALLVGTTMLLIAVLDPRVMAIFPSEWGGMFLLSFFGLFIGFLLREGTATSPILNLSLFKNRMFAFSTLCLFLETLTHHLTSFVFPFYLQDVLHFTPSFMGVLFMSAPLFTMVLSPAAGYLSDKVGPRLPATTGLALSAVAPLLGTILRPDSHWLLPTLMLALGGVGSGLFATPNHAAMISAVPEEYRGVAGGALQMTFGLANIFGISLGSYLMTSAFRFHTGVDTATPTPSNPTVFVAALNYTFLVVAGINLVAVIFSLMRGSEVKGETQGKKRP